MYNVVDNPIPPLQGYSKYLVATYGEANARANRRLRRRRLGDRVGRRGIGQGEQHEELGAVVRDRVDQDVAAVLVDDAVRERKSHATAVPRGLRGEKRLEHPVHDVLRDAWAIVAHVQLDIMAIDVLPA